MKHFNKLFKTLKIRDIKIKKNKQMSRKNIFGIIVSVIGLAMMGFEMGKNSKNGESNALLHFGGLFIVFVGVFIVSFNKKKSDKQ